MGRGGVRVGIFGGGVRKGGVGRGGMLRVWLLWLRIGTGSRIVVRRVVWRIVSGGEGVVKSCERVVVKGLEIGRRRR